MINLKLYKRVRVENTPAIQFSSPASVTMCGALCLHSEVSSAYTSIFVYISLLVLKTQVLRTARTDPAGSAPWFRCPAGGSALAREEPPHSFFLWLQSIQLL